MGGHKGLPIKTLLLEYGREGSRAVVGGQKKGSALLRDSAAEPSLLF